jgi:alginate O-acetyltransferase complex protein AlgI
MLFNSYEFIFLFLTTTLIIFFGLLRFRLIKVALFWLTLSSFFFYGYWNPSYLILIILSLAFNHQIGGWIISAKREGKATKRLLWFGIFVNLLFIGYYKYANFFLTSFNRLFSTHFEILEIILPLGISFYTFTQVAYLVDIYREENKQRNYDFVNYALFITYFPQLIAGPILRHDELIPQFNHPRTFIFSHKNFALGLTIFSLGLAKKVLIADHLSPWVVPVFSHADSVGFIEAWVGALSYTFQLYFDFSGYSDMAIGLALMFNISLPINFDSPYKALSISDFWRRWHITLSHFLRDYLYIPLGGNRRGKSRRYINLMVAMLLGGLWHGAGWTYVVWGGLHGLYLCIDHGWKQLKINLPKIIGWSITFLAVVFAWVLFRAHTFHEAIEIIKAMLGMKGIVLPGNPQGKLSFLNQLGIQIQGWKDFAYLPEFNGNKAWSLLSLAILMACVVTLPNTQQIAQKVKPTWWWSVLIGGLASVCLLSLNRVSEFLYFQF